MQTPLTPILRALVCAVALTAQIAWAESVEFSGARAYPVAELRTAIAEQLIDIESKGLTMARADDAAFFLGGFYRKNGYSRVEVKYEIRGRTLALQIKEGPRALLRSLKFVGNRNKPGADLAQFFAGVPMEGLAAANIPYTEAEVSAGGDRIRGYYLSEGWLDVQVDTVSSQVTADGTAADVVVNVVEGMHYTFGEVTFTGGEGYTRAELIAALGAPPEGTYTPALADAMQGSLRSWLRGRGHFSAQVVVAGIKEQSKGGRVPLNFVVTTGPKFRVTSVQSRGLDRVTPRFIEQRFRKITGEPYDPAKLDEKYRELLRTGLFRTIRVVPKEEGKDRLRIDVEVEEAKQKEFGFELGFGSYDGLIAGIKLGDRNLMRSGRPLTLSLETSQRGFEGELLYVDQWFLESDWTLRARLYSQFRDEEGYGKTAVGLRVEGSRKLTPRWEVTAFTEFANAKITAEEIDPLLLGPLDYTLAAIGIAQKLDYRDDPLNPRRGFVFTLSGELDAVNSELAFGRVSAKYSHYYPIKAFGPIKESMFAVGLRAGWIIPFTDVSDVPIDLRYFNGGGSTVRSFAERDLGPKDKGGHPLGGAFYTVANVEWDFPLTSTLGGAVFFDAGNLLADDQPGQGDMRYAIGVGLRYQLPIGPMRLDYGYNPAPKAGDDPGALHFSFGFAF